MGFIFEFFVEIIIESYVFAMAYFSKNNKKVNKKNIRYIVIFECFVFILMFITGGIMLLETDGESVVGKILFISSIVVSVSQILLGVILHKKRKNNI